MLMLRFKAFSRCSIPLLVLQKGETHRSSKRAPAEAGATSRRKKQATNYIFFAEQVFVAEFQLPPALAQAAAVFAVVTSLAKAEPVKASVSARANAETVVFMAFLLYAIKP
jgi:hypothetical protein